MLGVQSCRKTAVLKFCYSFSSSLSYLFLHLFFTQQMTAYNIALRSQVDCIEIDVSRSADGVLLALHDR